MWVTLADVMDAKGWSGVILIVAGIVAAISIVMRKGKAPK